MKNKGNRLAIPGRYRRTLLLYTTLQTRDEGDAKRVSLFHAGMTALCKMKLVRVLLVPYSATSRELSGAAKANLRLGLGHPL